MLAAHHAEPPVTDATAPARERLGRRRWLWVAVAGVLVAAGLALDASIIGGLVVLFVVVVPLEKLFPRHRQRIRRKGLGTDLAYAAAQPVLGVLGITVAVVVGLLSFAWLPGLLLRPAVAALPDAVRAFAAVALFDLAGYWSHRWSHEVPFLWRFHSVHHSSERMDWVSGIRAHPVDGALLAPPFAFLVGAGFSPEVTGALAAVQLVAGLFLHANVRWRLRPLQRIVATPEFHHWHHADEDGARASNYAAFLPAWDLAFGTWFVPRHRRPQRYGVTVPEPVPDGLLAQLHHPVRGLPNPIRALRHPVLAVRRLLRAVGRGVRQVWWSTSRPTRSRSFTF